MYFEIGSEEKENHVLLVGATLDRMFAGIAEINDPTVHGGIRLFPCLDLLYPEDDLPVILAVAKEMDRIKQRPTVYIDQKKGRFYIAVIFEFTAQDLQFLIDIVASPAAQDLKEVSGKIPDYGMKIIMTGEAELGGPVDAFLELFKEKGYYVVLISKIMDGSQKPIALWRASLTSFVQGMLCEW